MISGGTIVTLAQQQPGEVWVVHSQNPDGRWRIRMKADKGWTDRSAGEGDLSVKVAAPVYAVGEEIEREDGIYIVKEDMGDYVALTVPAKRFWHESTDTYLHVPGGNTETVPKGDLVLELL